MNILHAIRTTLHVSFTMVVGTIVSSVHPFAGHWLTVRLYPQLALPIFLIPKFSEFLSLSRYLDLLCDKLYPARSLPEPPMSLSLMGIRQRLPFSLSSYIGHLGALIITTPMHASFIRVLYKVWNNIKDFLEPQNARNALINFQFLQEAIKQFERILPRNPIQNSLDHLQSQTDYPFLFRKKLYVFLSFLSLGYVTQKLIDRFIRNRFFPMPRGGEDAGQDRGSEIKWLSEKLTLLKQKFGAQEWPNEITARSDPKDILRVAMTCPYSGQPIQNPYIFPSDKQLSEGEQTNPQTNERSVKVYEDFSELAAFVQQRPVLN